jgi:hypothetical protein
MVSPQEPPIMDQAPAHAAVVAKLRDCLDSLDAVGANLASAYVSWALDIVSADVRSRL